MYPSRLKPDTVINVSTEKIKVYLHTTENSLEVYRNKGEFFEIVVKNKCFRITRTSYSPIIFDKKWIYFIDFKQGMNNVQIDTNYRDFKYYRYEW